MMADKQKLTGTDLRAVVRSLPGPAPISDGLAGENPEAKDDLLFFLRCLPNLAKLTASAVYEQLNVSDILWLNEQLGASARELRAAHAASIAHQDEETSARAAMAAFPWLRFEPILRAALERAAAERSALTAIETPQQLLGVIESLSAKSPLTDAFTARWQALPSERTKQREREDVSYQNQREHWIGWLENYGGPGAYGRKNGNRSAAYVYNHVVNPQMLVYLAEAAGLPEATIARAVDAALERAGSTMAAMSGAVRSVISWSTVEQALLRRVRRE